jgi:uncharacterized protein
MSALLASSILLLGALGSAKNTQPAQPAEISKMICFEMTRHVVSYDSKFLTERAMVYVFNNSKETLLNPVFQGTFIVGTQKFNGIQTDIRLGSPLNGIFYGVMPPGMMTNVVVTFRFPIASYSWGRVLDMKLKSAEKMKPNAPLTDANGMRQFLLRSTGPQITAAFKKNPELSKVRDSVKMPPMGMAILTGAVSNVKALEAAGYKIEGPYPNRLTALHIASASRGEMVNYIKKKSPAFRKDNQDYTPLTYAVFSCWAENVIALKPTKAQLAMIGGSYGNSALHDAAYIGEVTVIKALMDFGANPNLLNRHGEPPMVQAFNKDTSTVERIIAVMKPNLAIKIGKSKDNLLQRAVCMNKSAAVRLMMKKGIKPRAKNALGQDAFYFATTLPHPVDREQMKRILEGKPI